MKTSWLSLCLGSSGFAFSGIKPFCSNSKYSLCRLGPFITFTKLRILSISTKSLCLRSDTWPSHWALSKPLSSFQNPDINVASLRASRLYFCLTEFVFDVCSILQILSLLLSLCTFAATKQHSLFLWHLNECKAISIFYGVSILFISLGLCGEK